MKPEISLMWYKLPFNSEEDLNPRTYYDVESRKSPLHAWYPYDVDLPTETVARELLVEALNDGRHSQARIIKRTVQTEVIAEVSKK